MTKPPTTLSSRIGSRQVSGRGEHIAVANPAEPDHRPCEYTACTKDDVTAAVNIARAVFDTWRRSSASDRSRILLDAAAELSSSAETVADEIVAEMGKTITEARAEVDSTVRCLEYYAGQATSAIGAVLPPSVHAKRIVAERVPVGVIGCITPWNFPLLIPTYKVAPAVAFGNSVVVKPAEQTPGPALRLAEALSASGLPDGVVNICLGGPATGASLVASPVDGLSFTGSGGVGKVIARQMAGDHKRLQLEMGGKNASLVFEDADLEHAADLLVDAATGMCGQRCTATSRVVAVGNAYSGILSLLVDRFDRIRVGDPTLEKTEMGPLVSPQQLSRVERWMAEGERSAIRLTHRGKESLPKSGNYVAPTIFGNVDPGSPLAQEEIFGPVLSLIYAENADQAVRIANGTRYGLAASVFTQNLRLAMDVTDRLEAGVVHVNSQGPFIERYVPFGGRGGSGFGGREQGEAAREFYTEWKSIYIA